LTLDVCVKPDYLRAHVKAALLDRFSNRRLPDGSVGFFFPDNLTFGDGVYVSAVLAAAQAVEGVLSVTISRLERLMPSVSNPDLTAQVLHDGLLLIGPLEIVQLDNDPSFPENGVLTINVSGGR